MISVVFLGVPGAREPLVIKDLKAGDPASVGPYRLLGRLGAGGMGEVYLAKSPGGRLVAIKLIRPELADERGFRSRFASEISAARNVSGIYTAAVVDADSEAELPWMATVYVPGPSLTDAVEDNGPLPVDSCSPWRRVSPRPCRPSTGPAWSTATSSRPTCCSRPTAPG